MTLLKSNQKAKAITTKELVLTGMFTAIICVLSLISIPTQIIPFTMGLFAIFLTGALLPPRNALLAVLVYLLIGAIGIPVFANFKAGLSALTGPTGGYLMAYPLMSFITSLSYQYSKKYKVAALTIGMLLSLLVCYLLGTLWFTLILPKTFYEALALCVFPFILFDLLKIAFAVSLSLIIRKTVMKHI